LDEETVRDHARAMCEALVGGDVDRAIADFSDELRRNLGEVLALLPLPATEGTVESVQFGGTGYNVVIRLVGESEEVRIQTRWKERDGQPRVVEASHLSRAALAAESGEAAGEGSNEGEPAG
jgi:hypothetical protein